jgi:6-phosphogluconolactonase
VSGASFREVVVENRSALARVVAERIAELSQGAQSDGNGPLAIALSGGSTPKALYETLAAAPFLERVAWPRLELFFSDERAVPPDDAQSNYGLAARTLLSKIPSPAHRMVAESGAAEAYEQLIRSHIHKRRGGLPVFDLILLGMGDDGHTASLFPGTRALEDCERLVVMNEVPQKNARRMTFTYPLINAADRVWVLISGADKRDIVARCHAARASGERPYPILRVVPTDGELVWWLDQAAAGASPRGE